MPLAFDMRGGWNSRKGIDPLRDAAEAEDVTELTAFAAEMAAVSMTKGAS